MKSYIIHFLRHGSIDETLSGKYIGTTESVIVTHGGVIMTLLAVYGMPQAKPFEWVMDNGFGYSVRITPQLWQRDKIMEVFSVIPEKKDIED